MWVSACQKRYSGSSTGRFLKVVCTNIPDWEPRLIVQRAESIKWAETVYIFEPKDSIFSLWRVGRSVVSDSGISWTVARQSTVCSVSVIPLSMEFSRQECWSELPFPSPGDLPDPGIEPESPATASRFFTNWATKEAQPIFTGMVGRLNRGTFQQYITGSLRGIFFLKCEFLPNETSLKSSIFFDSSLDSFVMIDIGCTPWELSKGNDYADWGQCSSLCLCLAFWKNIPSCHLSLVMVARVVMSPDTLRYSFHCNELLFFFLNQCWHLIIVLNSGI